MIVKKTLLDILAKEMKCEYLSDLHFLSRDQRRDLAYKVKNLDPVEKDRKEWNDALHYLTGIGPEKNAAAAKEKLLDFLYLER